MIGTEVIRPAVKLSTLLLISTSSPAFFSLRSTLVLYFVAEMTKRSRREFFAAALAAAEGLRAADRPKGYLVNSTHLWSDDQKRFPYHRNATYRPPPKSVETYSQFVRATGIDHTV